jgi:hypothetical protein
MQVAAGAAAVLVADMAKKSWERARETVARVFGRGGQAAREQIEQEMRLLDGAQRRLAEAAETERSGVAKRLEQELTIQLAAFLQKYPDAAVELQALMDQSEEPASAGRVRADVRSNTGSQVLIAGHNVSAGNFTYRPDGEK